jgi:hypothetical protein
MAVEGLGEFVEVGIERIEPPGASESVPVTLRDDVSARWIEAKSAGTIP